MAAFTHVTVGTNNLEKARQFYDAVLAPLGLKRLKDFGDGGSCWGQTTEEFMVLKPADGKPATHANGGTISFEAPSRAAVAAFHKAALALGAKDEGAVGPRSFWPNAYAPRRQQARLLLPQGRIAPVDRHPGGRKLPAGS
jgi:catechol 2,3-dioxygenase-like lactoylglutathione lyase family enzyme